MKSMVNKAGKSDTGLDVPSLEGEAMKREMSTADRHEVGCHPIAPPQGNLEIRFGSMLSRSCASATGASCHPSRPSLQ
jgi:hypothetical protein